jgi:hypothetical protein
MAVSRHPSISVGCLDHAIVVYLADAVQVSFPGVGELVRNRAGRIEFVFDQQLVEALELGLAPVSRSSSSSSDKAVHVSGACSSSS